MTVRFALRGGPEGTATDTNSVSLLEERLQIAIAHSRVGEFDGSELGKGEIFLYAYGPDADKLFAAMRPVLASFGVRPGQALLRYGADSDTQAREAIFDL
ncbi:MAG: hypothetical protein ACRDPW_08270 [Mycobacteriales bacterium]